MCIKSNAVRRFYLVMNFPMYRQPTVLCVVKQYPLYRQLYEDTKNRELHMGDLQTLGLKGRYEGQTVRMIELEVPFDKLY